MAAGCALVAAVIDRHNDEIMKIVRAAFIEVADMPIEIETVALASGFQGDPVLMRLERDASDRSVQEFGNPGSGVTACHLLEACNVV